MKLHRLELEGFGPFLERQTVDFDAFDADGLFLISGRTGSGKSSILDGVCYSLYGTAPRYDGGDRGLRSDHAEPHETTQARLEFTSAGRRRRITRTPEYERPKARGDGMTPAKATVLLEELVDGEWIGLATKTRDVAELLDEVVGLDRDQFQQVILLAQNRFAEFLLAKNDDRQALLRTLFGSRRYEEYEQAFEQRRRDAQQTLMTDSALLDALLAQAEALIADNDLAASLEGEASSSARLDEIERAVPRAAYRADESARRSAEAEAQHDAALQAYGRQSALREKQVQRLTSRDTLRGIEEREPAVIADRDRLERARVAEALRDTVTSAARARAAAAGAAEAEATARGAWLAKQVGLDPSIASAVPTAELRARADVLSGDVAVWAKAAELERELPRLDAELRAGEESVAKIETAQAANADAQTARTARIAVLEPELAAWEASAPAVEPARDALASARQRLDAGREAARLASAAQSSEAAHLDAVRTHERAVATVRELLQRRLDGYAGELASTLADGEPCAVCGSTEHPNPAPGAPVPVTDELIAEAEASVEAAARTAGEASDLARATRHALQEASARAGGEPLDRLEASHEAAEARVAAAVEAAKRIGTLKRELEESRAAAAAAGVERDALNAQLTAAVQLRATCRQRVRDAHETVESARGEYAAVADRIADARLRRDLARSLADAADERVRLDLAAAEAEADRDERIAASVFADAAEATAALCDDAEQARLAKLVRAHEVALATERERLLTLETELAGEPDDPIDLTEAAGAAVTAREVWNIAVAVAARDAEVATQLTDAASRAAIAHDASAERAAEYEVIAGLANAVAGRTDSRMDLETFVLAAELEEIVEAANTRLDAMSSGRYRLQHTDAVAARKVASGLGLEVLDAYTGQARPPQSLSGGETFLASLALALGLAQVVTDRAGGVRLDTLFIDEGFGSLDAETLELAMQTLDELRQGGRTVGLISHVETMKDRLPARLVVEATPQGPSVIRQGAALPV